MTPSFLAVTGFIQAGLLCAISASHFTAAVRDCLCTLSLKVDRIISSSFISSCQGMRLKVGIGLKPYSPTRPPAR